MRSVHTAHAVAALLAFHVLLAPRPVHAEPSSLPAEVGYNYGQIEDARAAAFGGELAALGNGLSGVFGNPAAIGASQVYHVGALAAIWPEASRQTYGAGAVDSITTRLAAGVGFAWTDQDPSGVKRRSSDLRLVLAYPFSDKISFGVAARYLKLTQEGLGPLGQSYASGGLAGQPIVNTWTFDAGFSLRPTKSFGLGAFGKNLSNPGTGFQPTMVGGGLGLGTQDLAVELNAVADFTTWQRTTARVMGGVEYLAGDHVPLRVGYRWDQGMDGHALNAGIGYIDPQFSIDLSARRYVVGPSATAVMLTVQYFVESSGITRSPSLEY